MNRQVRQPITVHVHEIVRKTDKAALIRVDDADGDVRVVWVPLSQVLEWSPIDAEVGDECDATLSAWIAEKVGIS